ncbi:MAG: protein-L-isoaspartate(D-aspartate) O-methyltransferase [Phycisphaeraceae bacterium]
MHTEREEYWQPLAHELVRSLEQQGIADAAVLDAMQRVPRHEFIPDATLESAYRDCAMQLSKGQTISQPFIVAIMTQLLDAKPGQRVLEIGCGSGYQAAVLLELGVELVSVERFPSLASAARQRLAARYDADRFEIVEGDGSLGHPDGAPYDRILVTAAAPRPPLPLRRQLADPGRMVLPLGDRAGQKLCVLELLDGTWTQHESTPCRFVPLVGEHGFDG